MGKFNRSSCFHDSSVGDSGTRQEECSTFRPFAWVAICLSIIVIGTVCLGFNMGDGHQYSDRQDVRALSGGKNNLPKRFRPNQAKPDPVKDYSEVNDRARWMIRTIMIAIQQDVYLFGSWMNQNWWVASDLDLCIETAPTAQQKRQVDLLGKQFGVTIDFRQCGRGAKVKCIEEY